MNSNCLYMSKTGTVLIGLFKFGLVGLSLDVPCFVISINRINEIVYSNG